jgi:hypothetical protein
MIPSSTSVNSFDLPEAFRFLLISADLKLEYACYCHHANTVLSRYPSTGGSQLAPSSLQSPLTVFVGVDYN